MPRRIRSLLIAALVALPALGVGGAGRAQAATSSSPTGQAPASFWLATADGGVWNFGQAGAYGSAGALKLAQPIVAMAPTPTGKGYWLVARDGGVFSFGDATFHGSTGAIRLAQPIVGMAPTSTGKGYWLVARDGGVFSFGDATFHGSTGAIRLAQPIVGMAATPDNRGYRLLAADGGVFTFGSAGFFGSLGGAPSPEPAARLVSSADGRGYWIVAQNGTATAFGDAAGAPPAQGLLFTPTTPGDKAMLFAFRQLGKPYVWGGNGPDGFDCSGLVLASWRTADNVTFARIANDQYHTAGPAVPYSQLVAGDLVFWGTSQTDWTSVYHAAMYVGGGRIVEATGDHVQLNSLTQWGTSDLMPHGVRP